MAKDRGKSLAARLRAGIDSQLEAHAREQAEAKERMRHLSAERERLFDDLSAFGEAVGHLKVKRSKDSLDFMYSGNKLHFKAVGDSDRIHVSGGDVPDHTEIVMQEELKLWIVKSPVGLKRVEQDPLFDKGLERIMVLGLGIE